VVITTSCKLQAKNIRGTRTIEVFEKNAGAAPSFASSSSSSADWWSRQFDIKVTTSSGGTSFENVSTLVYPYMDVSRKARLGGVKFQSAYSGERDR
jgi:hypothetical protein